MVSMVLVVPPARRSYHIMTAARGATQGQWYVGWVSQKLDSTYNLDPTRDVLLLRLQRVLHGIEGRELHGVELAIHLLDLADVDVLDDVARLRVDRDRSARALPLH